jgi:hypothetical protein
MRKLIQATKIPVTGICMCNYEICQPIMNSAALECLPALIATSRYKYKVS